MFPRRSRRGLIEARRSPRELVSLSNRFRGEVAAASLKPEAWQAKQEEERGFRGEVAAASLKQCLIHGLAYFT